MFDRDHLAKGSRLRLDRQSEGKADASSNDNPSINKTAASFSNPRGRSSYDDHLSHDDVLVVFSSGLLYTDASSQTAARLGRNAAGSKSNPFRPQAIALDFMHRSTDISRIDGTIVVHRPAGEGVRLFERQKPRGLEGGNEFLLQPSFYFPGKR